MIEKNQNSHLLIRDVVEADLLDVYNLICDLENEKMDYQLFAKVFHKNLVDPSIKYFVAVVEQCLVGLISLHVQNILHHSNPTGEVQELIISPNFQGHGVGTLLMQKVENVARELKLEEIELTSRIYRERVHIFYKQLGYVNTHYKFVKKLS